MREVGENGRGGVVAALVKSYASDLGGWAGRLATGYAVAAALLVGGVLALFAAIAVGITALFGFLERAYGMEIAYAAIGGGLLILALVLFLMGWLMLRRKAPPLPRPRRQVQAARKVLVRAAAPRAIGSSLGSGIAQADPTTRLLFGAAAMMLMGWIAASRFRSSTQDRRASP